MKRHLCLSILCAALAAPAFGGADIVKCVDESGRVTLTDQPCDGGAATVRLASMPADDSPARVVQAYPLAVEHGVLPPPQPRRVMAPRVKAKPLTQDVATLKAARANFLLMDTSGKQTLATLD